MATRFGGVVKGAVEAVDGRSFLSWKLGETARLAEELGDVDPGRADDELPDRGRDAGTHVASLGVPEPLWFSQSVSLRLTEDGDLFLEDGRPSLYAPGHGDLVDAIRRSGTLDELRRRGVEHVDDLERRQPRRAARSRRRRCARPCRATAHGRGRA